MSTQNTANSQSVNSTGKSNLYLERQSTGIAQLDTILGGGYEKDIITTIYGPSGAGKTTLCMHCLLDVVSQKKKVIYIDTEASFSTERLSQLISGNSIISGNSTLQANLNKSNLSEKDTGEINKQVIHVMSQVLFFKPINFKEQKKAFDKLRSLISDSIGLIIVDTISMLYRLEMGQTKDVYDVNKQLGIQLSFLSEISRKKKVPILVANQVYANFEEKDKVNMVGGDILRYGSKTLLELQNLSQGNRILIVKKSRNIAEGTCCKFSLTSTGISPCN